MTIPRASDRPSAVAWARALLARTDVLFLDTETTGLGPRAEIVDLAIVAVDGTVLVNQLVKPARPIPIDAMLIHGITNEHVAGAPCWAEVMAEVMPLLAGRTVIAYNSSFDRDMIARCCSAATIARPEVSWECAMRAYAAFRKDRTQRAGGYRWRPLHEAAESFGLTIPTHRALADAMACHGVVRGMSRG